MNYETLLKQLFPKGYSISTEDVFFSGHGSMDEGDIALMGTIDATPIGIEIALKMAENILAIIEQFPKRPILLLVDTQGQRLSHRDELLGINGYMAHLAKSIELARINGHRIIGLVYSKAVSGGFLASSLLSDFCFALPEAEVEVMNLPAMSRITKIPLEHLQSFSKTSPIFAPGAENYVRMGAIDKFWTDDLSLCLSQALKRPLEGDQRRKKGDERGGRLMAYGISEKVRHG
jgi:malonate decarboxylase gamma subunit